MRPAACDQHSGADCSASQDGHPVGTGLKQPGPEVSHSPPSSAEVKKQWSCTSTITCLLGLFMPKQTLIAVAAIECFLLSPSPTFLAWCYLSGLHTDLLHLILPLLLSLSITIITSYPLHPEAALGVRGA